MQYLKEELAEILKLHLMWLKSDDGGKRADLRNAYLECRAEFAKVIEIFNSENGQGISSYDNSIIYKVGKTIKPDKLDDNRWDECSHGIHFLITRAEAEAY